MNKSVYSVDRLACITKIHEHRLAKYELVLLEVKEKFNEIKEKVVQRNKLIESLLTKKQSLIAYSHKINTSHNYSIETQNRLEDVRYWINYDIEMHEYYLSQEKAELEEAENVYNEKKQIWLRQKIKLNSFIDTYRSTKKSTIYERTEKVDEEELEDKYSRMSY
jgi:hypothetical protein